MLRQAIYFFLLLFASFASMLREEWMRAAWRAKRVRIAKRVTVVAHSQTAIEMSHDVAIGLGTLLLATTEMSALPTERSFLRIGPYSAINEYCNIRACGGDIRIGTKCIIAQMVSIVASNHSMSLGQPMMDQLWSTSPLSVSIGDDVWIGTGAIILPGTQIGDGAVIAAGSVVRGQVPAGEIWGGVPARRLKQRTEATITSQP